MRAVQVFLTTLGCRLNEAELESWSRNFRAQGHRVVGTPLEAQLMVINTCAVTSEAARKSRKFISGLHRQNPQAPMVVTGCFSQLEPERAAELAGVDLVVANADKERLVEIVVEKIDPSTMPAMAAEPEGSHVYASPGRTRAFVKVQDGCRNRCTFCIVTVARGEERSRTVDDIVDELNALEDAGYQEAILCGVHLGGYGADIDTNLSALVEQILERTTIPRVRLSSLEPWDLPEGFFALWKNPRLMPHLHLPLQSGSDAVLKRMSRRCSAGSFAELIQQARATIPDLTVTTDIIVGFPGESESEWHESMSFVEQIGFGHMHIFSYSQRTGTKAATLGGQLRGDVKRARSRQLHELAARMKHRHLARFVGQQRPVLWEGTGHPEEDGSLRWSGYTDNYLRVYAMTASDVDLDNRITPASLEAANEQDGILHATLSAIP